jgi:hypothetical protein
MYKKYLCFSAYFVHGNEREYCRHYFIVLGIISPLLLIDLYPGTTITHLKVENNENGGGQEDGKLSE